ncbi:integrase, catalytic region, zinc finger, CCHC-type containing protein [Tanacetum coccineum]
MMPMHKVQNNNDNYNVFAMENEHPEQPESSNHIYLAEQGDTKITIDSLDICYDRDQDDQDDTDDLDQERDLLASLIQKLKCEIDDSKNRNKFLESSNKALVDKLKAPESDETIRLDKESRSKLSDLIRPFDYDKLNNLYDLFVPQREKSPEQHYFPTTSKMSHTSSNNETSKCVLNDNHDLCVLHYINGVSSRTRQPIAVPISTREPKHNVNQSVATSSKKTIATDSTVKKSRNITRKLYEQIILFIVDSGCSKHMTGNLKLLTNFVEKFLGTVKFGNDQIAPILGYGDLVQGTITIKRVYYVEGLNHNLFSVGQFCDADLEVAFRKSTCYIRDLKERSSHIRNRTFVEAARTMLSAAKVPLFFWAEAIATTCFTSKPSLRQRCKILNKMKEKGDACIFVGYSTQSKAYRVFNKRTRIIVETIHVNFDELPQMASDHVSSDPVPQCSTTVLEQDSLSPGPQSQENVPQVAETVTTSNELELLYSPMFSEILNGTSPVVSKSSAVHAADNPDKRQQHNTTHTSTTTDVADPPPLNIQSTHQTPTQVPTVTAPENIIQAETNTKNAQFDDDEFINIFSTPVQERGETSSRHVDSSNMHTFYQHHPSAQRWTKDHPLEQVIGIFSIN